MRTSWTVGGRLADRFAGGPEYARAKARSEQRALRRKGACRQIVAARDDSAR